MAVGVLNDGGEQPLRAEIVLYQADGANVPVSVRYMNDTMWLTQREMGELFGTTASNVSMHLKNIFAEGELAESDSVIKFRISEFNKKPSNLYNLDAIIAVGYRVNSLKATRFRQWATATLKEYIVKGYVLNDDMLKNGAPFGKDYFDELIVRIRDIRASERRVYQKITDIFQECSFDYDKNSETARRFYATVQNKLHYAITGHTAAEIIAERSDAGKPSMGLTSWKGAPEGPIHSSDVTVAKNYLTYDEMETLNRLVAMFLDDAELRAKDQVLTSMEDCERALDQFLSYNRREVLLHKGERTKRQADEKALREFAEFRKIQDRTYENDFEKEIKRIQGSKG
ncbi:virulence RhuM family protein [Rubneribacter badeniensis]|nr:virulence RhuM family protein [Rubneribacter badeniensis]